VPATPEAKPAATSTGREVVRTPRSALASTASSRKPPAAAAMKVVPATVSIQAPSTVPGTRPAVMRAKPPRSSAWRSAKACTSTIGVATASAVTGTASGATSSSAGTMTSA